MSERLVRLLRRRTLPTDGATDADLLRRWADGRDEAAFELLVRRHAEPVWRTCRAVAGADADDAFQATFLALARRAGGVRGNVGGWLHAVARHASLRARRAGGVSPPSQPQTIASSRSEAGTGGLYTPLASDECAILHAELARLPASYRVPVVLCHLHGRTQLEAARELGLPVGTVATRVRRGCDRLRVALTRRGLAPVVAFGPPLLVPADLLASSVRIGLGAAAPPAVQLLAQGAVIAMSRLKLKLLLGVVAVGAALTGGAMLARQPAADPPGPAPAAGAGQKPADFFDRREGGERLKKVLLALHIFHETNEGKFPRDIAGADGKPLLSWRVAVLPHVGEGFLYTQFKMDEPWDGPTNRKLAGYVPEVYRSPGAGAGRTRVKLFRGPRAALDPVKPLTFTDFTDGTSNTLAAAEAGPPIDWTKPGDLDVEAGKPLPDILGPFPDAFAAGMMDGSVRWVRRTMPEKTLREFISRDGGEVTPWDADGPAGQGKRPLTDREQKQAAEWRAILERNRKRDQWELDRRVAVTVALAKFGPVPLPPIPPADDLHALEQAVNDSFGRPGADSRETDRLFDLLKAKDPATAAKLAKEFDDRLRVLRGKQ